MPHRWARRRRRPGSLASAGLRRWWCWWRRRAAHGCATAVVSMGARRASCELGAAAVTGDGESLKTDCASEITPMSAAPVASTATARRASRWARVVGRFDRRGVVSHGWVPWRGERSMPKANSSEDPPRNPDTELRDRGPLQCLCGKVTAWRPGSFCCAGSTSAVPTGWPWRISGN